MTDIISEINSMQLFNQDEKKLLISKIKHKIVKEKKYIIIKIFWVDNCRSVFELLFNN